HRFADPFDLARTEGLEDEVALALRANCFGCGDRPNRSECLHSRCNTCRVTDGCIFGATFAGGDRSRYHLAGIHSYSCLDGKATFGPDAVRVALQLLLHPECGEERALGMVLLSHRCAE